MRVAPKPPRDYPWYLAPIFWLQRRRFGEVLAPTLLWARSPRLYLALSRFYRAIERRSSPLDPALRSLVMARVSQINACAFCIDLNLSILMKRGLGLDKVEALGDWRRSNRFEERERAALDYAEVMTRTDGAVDDALAARLKRHFSDDGLVELTAVIAFQNLSSKFNRALDVPAQGFCARSPPAAERPD